MSEHTTGHANWTTDEQQLYRERRDKGLRGQLSVATTHRLIKDEDGNEQRMPLGNKIGALLSRGKSSGLRSVRRHPEPVIKQQRKATGRGE